MGDWEMLHQSTRFLFQSVRVSSFSAETSFVASLAGTRTTHPRITISTVFGFLVFMVSKKDNNGEECGCD